MLHLHITYNITDKISLKWTNGQITDNGETIVFEDNTTFEQQIY